jgi:hypothetical protein
MSGGPGHLRGPPCLVPLHSLGITRGRDDRLQPGRQVTYVVVGVDEPGVRALSHGSSAVTVPS